MVRSISKLRPKTIDLKTGQKYEIRINLNEWFDFPTEGCYVIRGFWCGYGKGYPFIVESKPVMVYVYVER